MTAAPDADRALLTDLTLARGTVDRAAERRTDDSWLTASWADPATRVLLADGGRAPVVTDSGRVALALVPTRGIPASYERHLLGVDAAGTAYWSARPTASAVQAQSAAAALPGPGAVTGTAGDIASDAAGLVPADARWESLRKVGSALDDRDAGLFVTAVALDNWHDVHVRCPRCGAPTEPVHAGWVRRCSADGSDHFPRTDPAVIMLTIDATDRALLGRRATFPGGLFSTLAGFVEPGESAEAAVRREVAEEAGVAVGEVVYLGSQPWPFPCSLMLGYHCVVADGADPASAHARDGELAEVRWFSREELATACASGDVGLPPALSIARRLIERWYGGPLPVIRGWR